MYFVFREDAGAVGVIATRIVEIFGRGEQDVFTGARLFVARRFGKPKVQGSSLVLVGAEAHPRAISRYGWPMKSSRRI